ncbi:nuclear transport factor 2 family protein [Rhizorhapis suberifaciens]|uniref:SnoaL-like domain-containing protein n=1 Tax=Rhizorhapis suberifaciens TaxID=13656 RepID=A0A840HZ32_9SPHN|nr:nuclear transport factor 2 family protein [Rhizorhapis suberifaciens]MBB4642911.1 hypothetical protein [Rhizorhapis suberifaciens]
MDEKLQRLMNREEIRDLVSRFSAYEDRRMWDEAAECFTEDGVFDETAVGGPRSEGREQIRAFFKEQVDVAMTFLAHYTTGHVITEQSDDEAKGFFNCFFEGGLHDGTVVKVHSYLDDTYARVDGKWLFKSHKVVLYAPREFIKRSSETV